MGGCYLLEIAVPMGMSKPYFILAEGTPDGIYIRSGSSTLRAKPEHIEELQRLNRNFTYDSEPLNIAAGVLSPKLLRRIYGANFTDKTLIADKVLIQATAGQFFPSRAAVLMFCEAPHDHIPEAIAIVSHFKGTAGRDIIRSAEVEGPIPELIDKVIKLVSAWTEVNFKLRGVVLQGVSTIPELALREIVANAFIHRKYSIAGAVKIAIFEDRIEIFSPGDLPVGIRIEDLGCGVTDLRNPLLAKFARKFKLMEKLGSGISTACRVCRESSLREPEFTEGANYFKTLFRFEKSYQKGIHPDDLAIKIVQDEGVVTKKSLVQQGIADRTASKALSDLVQQGILRKIGRGPSTKYILMS